MAAPISSGEDLALEPKIRLHIVDVAQDHKGQLAISATTETREWMCDGSRNLFGRKLRILEGYTRATSFGSISN